MCTESHWGHFLVDIATNPWAFSLRLCSRGQQSHGMWTVSACRETFVSAVRRNRIPHWILLICTDHALILRYRAASPLLQETLQIDIWQLRAEERGRLGLSFASPFSFAHCQYVTRCHSPESGGNFALVNGCSLHSQFLWSHSWLQSVLQKEEWTKKRRSVSATSLTLCTPSVLEGK